MGSTRLARLVWPGMILAGLALGAVVWAVWPEPTTRIVRLPYGEALPKTPREAAPTRQATPAKRVVAAPARTSRPQPVVVQPDEEAGRVLAAVEPDPSSGPPPVPSDLELDSTYVQESPEELGAEPLPGAGVTPAPPPVAG